MNYNKIRNRILATRDKRSISSTGVMKRAVSQANFFMEAPHIREVQFNVSG